MNVDSISLSRYTSQLSTSGSDQTRQAPPAPPPGPPPGEGGFVSVIGSALESLGVTDVASSDKESASSALGSFLQALMTSLHAQGDGSGAESGASTAVGGAAGQCGPGGSGAAGGTGGPGRLAADLKSLISSLQSDSSATDGTSSLASSFSSLLQSLGADSSDSQAKLASFLQTLADKLPQSGSSGNLINTTA